MANRNREILNTIHHMVEGCYDYLPKKWVVSYDIMKSPKGYYLETRHRKIYVNTPEIVELLSAIQVANARQVQALLREIV